MKSIFDGWEKQIFGKDLDSDGGLCAMGAIGKLGGHSVSYTRFCPDSQRIGRWIQANMSPPQDFQTSDGDMNLSLTPASDAADAIIWANDSGALDIDGFKMVDLLTQGFVPEDQPSPVEAEGVGK